MEREGKDRLILRNFQAPGDVVMLTAAVRDLHMAYPERFITEVRTSFPELWENNPFITTFGVNERGLRVIDCHYPLVHKSNILPYHFLHGFIHYLNAELGLNIMPTAFSGDIHLSDREREDKAFVNEMVGTDGPFWLINAGGKSDFTIKWWDAARYQTVVDGYRDRIRFVQVGAKGHHHPALSGVRDLRGKTSLRDLIRLTHFAEGVVTPVSLLMHLAAAVERPSDTSALRPCVVIAGGREPVHWEAYPGHRFLHTIGALPCCAEGGCWRSRTVPLLDGSKNDTPENLCVNVVGKLPHCMDIISTEDVVRSIDSYFIGGTLSYLDSMSSTEAESRKKGADKPKGNNYVMPAKLDEQNSREMIEGFMAAMPSCPDTFSGRGIVICGGGAKYFPGVWVLVNMLRYLGCHLPIEVWYLGRSELDLPMEQLLTPLGVTCVDGLEVSKTHPCRILKGWELKAFALVHSAYKEVLLLDADNVPTISPDEIFSWPEYKRTGAVFWPDVNKLSKGRMIWDLVGTPYRDEPEFESGQILVDKSRCWEALRLSLWINEYSDFYYHYIHGDKETFHMAFRKMGTEYAMPPHHVVLREGVMYQHDFRGRVLFQHRNGHKWAMGDHNNPILHGFQFELECRAFLGVLGNVWDGTVKADRINGSGTKVPSNGNGLVTNVWFYERLGFDRRPMVFQPNGRIGIGSASCEQQWRVEDQNGQQTLVLSGAEGDICRLSPDDQVADVWIGRWLLFEQMPIKLVGINRHTYHEIQ